MDNQVSLQETEMHNVQWDFEIQADPVISDRRPELDEPYLPTPPLGQDMTQGQIFKRSLTGSNSEFSLLLD